MTKGVAWFFSVTSVATLVLWPPFTGGRLAEVTCAWAFMDAPSGLYYDRQFDWPTGEAIWVDLPAWYFHIALASLAAGAWSVSFTQGLCRTMRSSELGAANAAPSRSP